MNEEEMLPFFLQHYSSFCDEIIIYDGGSVDNSLAIINKSMARVVKQDHKEMDERVLISIRNEAWKQDREKWDWQIVIDIDEILYKKDILKNLQQYTTDGITMPVVTGYDMYSLSFPIFSNNKTIVDHIKTGCINDFWQSKNVIFDPKKVDINYNFGCHPCKPVGNIKSGGQLYLLHFNYVGYDHFIKRRRFHAPRLCDFNKQNGLAFHIPIQANMTRQEFEDKVKLESLPLGEGIYND